MRCLDPPALPPAGGWCNVRGHEAVRIAIAFFGITRAMPITLPGLRANLLEPAAAAGAADVFVHALLGRVDNSHFAHEHAVPCCEYDFMQLRPCSFAAQRQAVVDADERLPSKAAATEKRSALLYKAYYDVPTITNVYRSRYSLEQVGKLVLAHQRAEGFEYTHVIAARPDAAFLWPLQWAPLAPAGIRVANYEHGGAAFTLQNGSRLVVGGLNDRFAYGDARSMLGAYMTQYSQQLSAAEGTAEDTRRGASADASRGHDQR